ncbi:MULTISPECIES: MscL family protein [unclassified Nocardioides]|jgi:large conductance mechanosensitive channel|uniref:MscL family protein n=1 Tax=unclassified Nocardioides TaxID=2615069 RepID=UPI000703AC62|nr:MULTISPECIES: MscL family protein [unclassified Nocardioides]KRC53813.1 mechanosensitive ion channel protein MscL [Nocardioides sp. Root79]KRC71148.1 mechanosensitive ion channel protein MscL [Nocardioides sp. Root240]
MDGFKKFILKGNLVDLAVAFIIGTAFAAVVKTFTDVLMGFVSRVFGGSPNFDNVTIWKDEAGVGIPIGTFITAVISFLILAAILYFLVVLPYTKAKERFFPDAPEAPAPEVELLTQIRDSLAAR